MAPPPLLRVLLLLLLFVSVFSATSDAVSGCMPYRCGGGGNISYPFWHQDGPNRSESYCGYPSMGLTCSGGSPTLLTDFNNYTVTKIDTSNRTISLVDVDVEDTYCPWVRQNLTFDGAHRGVFQYAPFTSNITFFFNCTFSLPKIPPIRCIKEVWNLASYVIRDWVVADSAYNTNLSGSCQKIVMAPVDKRRVEQVFRLHHNFAEGLGSALHRGFQLQWKKPDINFCKECEGSGGFCGFSNGADVCYCTDGHHREGSCHHGSRTKTKTIILVVSISVSTALFFASLLCCFFKSNRKKRKGPTKVEEEVTSGEARKYGASSGELGEEELKKEGAELPFFEFELLVAATGNFSDSNRIGQGGFGIVYKGKFNNRSQIAVKRLSMVSRQGLEEFKNEVMMIAKLQHRNLVRLLGCCIQGIEKILIYEFLPNGSLDSFLFGNEKRMLFNWKKRFNIIKGIAKGLLYLHEDSRLRIIHRDLKSGNILLDEDMNPKISDFGMARIFGGDQNEANTTRVVGTYGYMSPEYVLKGHFSMKSDVYSYGVLVLEILSGKKISSFHCSSFLTLPSYAWQLWQDNRLVELVDPSMVGVFEMDEVLRCLHVALLCVQDSASDRPTMSSVVHMLENLFISLDRQPKQPTFTVVVDGIAQNPRLKISQSLFSINELSITKVEGR